MTYKVETTGLLVDSALIPILNILLPAVISGVLFKSNFRKLAAIAHNITKNVDVAFQKSASLRSIKEETLNKSIKSEEALGETNSTIYNSLKPLVTDVLQSMWIAAVCQYASLWIYRNIYSVQQLRWAMKSGLITVAPVNLVEVGLESFSNYALDKVINKFFSEFKHEDKSTALLSQLMSKVVFHSLYEVLYQGNKFNSQAMCLHMVSVALFNTIPYVIKSFTEVIDRKIDQKLSWEKDSKLSHLYFIPACKAVIYNLTPSIAAATITSGALNRSI